MERNEKLKSFLVGVGCSDVDAVLKLSPTDLNKIGEKIRGTLSLGIASADTIILKTICNLKSGEQT